MSGLLGKMIWSTFYDHIHEPINEHKASNLIVWSENVLRNIGEALTIEMRQNENMIGE